MDSIKIVSGVKRIAINDDPDRVIEFNPSDSNFRTRFYTTYRELMTQLTLMGQREKELIDVADEDEFGIPTSAGDRLALELESIQLARQKIDELFGAGTSQTVFGDEMSQVIIGQFFDGIQPFFESAVSDAVKKYARPKARGNGKRKVMNG
jgi:hypothetical protein